MYERLERIYREHRQGLFALALSITQSRESAEDAVHDAFVRLWRSNVQAQGDPVAYVFASVRNAAIDATRRRKSTAELPESLFAGRRLDPAAEAEQTEQTELLRRAVDGLPEEQREVIVLRLYAGLSFRQMGETLNEPLQTVASRYRRALERVRGQIEDLR